MYCVNLPEVMIGNAQQKFDEHGNLKDDLAKQLMSQLLENLVALAKKLS
jgi:chromate reductase